METKQPIWKYAGRIGDVDPVSYGGGFIYTDETGVYPPEVVYFEPASDAEWKEKEDAAVLTVYRFILEKDSAREWWFESLSDIAKYTGQNLSELESVARANSPVPLAQLYADLISYHGVENFDSYPVQMTEREAREKYAVELKEARQ
jgi:hypothetical protein